MSLKLSAFQSPRDTSGRELMLTDDELRRLALSLGVLPSTNDTLMAAHCDRVFQLIMARLIELIGEDYSVGSIRRTIERFVASEGLRHIFIETSAISSLSPKGNKREMVVIVSIKAAGCSCLQHHFRQKN